MNFKINNGDQIETYTFLKSNPILEPFNPEEYLTLKTELKTN